MSIQLTPEQEQRIRSIIDRGAYDSVEEVVDAALGAVEQQAFPGFDGSEKEIEALITEGLESGELTESEFWSSLRKQTAEMMEEYKRSRRS